MSEMVPRQLPFDHFRLGETFFKVAAGLGVTASAATFVDGVIGHKVWPSEPTRLVGITPETEEAALTFGGLGSTDTARQSELGKLVLPGEPVYWDYSTDKVSIDEMAGIFQSEAKSLEVAHINGHSMGGPLGLEVVRRADLPKLKLGHVVLHCPPYRASDVRLSGAIDAMQVCRWPQGPGSKFAFSLVRGLLEGRSLKTNFERAKFDATNGCSPRQWGSMVRLLKGLNIGKHVEDYKRLVGPDTRFTYCMPEDPGMDDTIFTEKASNGFAEFADRLGSPFEVCRVSGAGHADVERDCRFMAEQRAVQCR